MRSSDTAVTVRVERVLPLDPVTTRVTFRPTGGRGQMVAPLAGGYCRLGFPDSVAGTRTRVFTYRRVHPDGSFDVDFARHAGDGPAARWIARAGQGDEIGWHHGGPPKLSLNKPGSGPFLLWGDATALPLIAALLETAHADCTATVVLDLPQAAAPDLRSDLSGVQVMARRNADSRTDEEILRSLTRDTGLFFVAGEAGKMRWLRRCALDRLGLPKERVLTSGYWMAGRTAEDVDELKQRRDWFGDRENSPLSDPLTISGL
jgi:NADPH-dependent ferric siderophore reductase